MVSFITAIIIILCAAFWGFQGVFGAAIMFTETLIALMVGFSFYEPLAANFKESLDPQLSEPAFLALLFFITLSGLRFLTDRYIPGNVRAHQLVDRVGGGILGFFTGMLILGVCHVAIQMLPLGRTTMGFERWTYRDDGREPVRNTIWFNPDGFTVSVVDHLSSGRFGDGPSLAVRKPDLLDDIYYRKAGTQPESRVAVPPDAMKLLKVYRTNSIHEPVFTTSKDGEPERNTEKAVQPAVGNTFLVCRVELKRDLKEPDVDDGGNASERDCIFFTPMQFRLVGPRPADGGGAAPTVYRAVGLSDIYLLPKGKTNPEPITPAQAAVLVKLNGDTPMVINDPDGRQRKVFGRDQPKSTPDGEAPKAAGPDKPYIIDVVFEVPDNDFKPWYIEFKNGGRVEITQKIAASPDESDDEGDAKSPAGKTPGKKPKKPAGGDDDSSSSGADASTSSGGESTAVKTGGDKPKPTGRQTKPAGAGDSSSKPQVGKAQGGRTHVANAKEIDITSKIPSPLPKDGLAGVVQGGKFHEGHKWVEIPNRDLSDAEAVKEFDVPDGKKMVQVRADLIFAGSVLGQSLEFARRTANQYYLEPEDGPEIWAIGVYIETDYDGKRIAEAQFWPSPEVPERCLEPATKLTAAALRARRDVTFVFLFLCDPGTKVIRFHTSRNRAQDLRFSVP